MCNRYSQTKRERDLVTRLGTLELSLEPRYNIAPTDSATVVRVQQERLCAEVMSWKFSRSDGGIVTNCKSESAADKPFFKTCWTQRRCLIPADGFYEWKQEGTRKQPYRFVLNSGEPFWFAGLWRPDESQTGKTANEFVILTRSANEDVAALHTRMPLILRPDEIDDWFVPSSGNWIPEGVLPGTLGSYPVAALVSRPGLESPECIAPFVAMARQPELF